MTTTTTTTPPPRPSGDQNFCPRDGRESRPGPRGGALEPPSSEASGAAEASPPLGGAAVATNASFEGGAEWSPAPAKLLRTRVDRPVDMGERGEDGHGRVGRVGAATLCVALRVTSYELLYVF